MIRQRAAAEIVVAGFALLALLAAQWMLSSAIHETNYTGYDGKMAQAIVLAAIKFGGFLQVTNLHPIEGVGSQLLPMNVWLNPAYWPFHVLNQALATDVSALIALCCFATACYIMARCFDLPIAACAVAAQLCIVLFAPTVLYLNLSTVFCLTPGNAVAYAPHMIALGLLTRLEPGSWRRFGLITAVMFVLLFYSLVCDPLWTTISGLSWFIAFAVVTLSPVTFRSILARGAALGYCLVLLFLTHGLEYLYTLSQYTARVQFAATVDRPRLLPYVSTAFYSPTTKYYYLACGLGCLLGMLTLRGRPRVLVVAAVTTFVLYVAFSAGFLWLKVPWMAPIPVYVEHSVFPLFMAAGVAGYWGAFARTGWSGPSVFAMIRRARNAAHRILQRTRIAAIRHGAPRIAVYLVPLSRLLHPGAAPRLARASSEAPSQVAFAPARSKLLLLRGRYAPIVLSLIIAAVLPTVAVHFAVKRSWLHADRWKEPWPNEPEFLQFLTDNVGGAVGQNFRGSVHFAGLDEYVDLTIRALWARGVPTVREYSQVVTPQAFYFLHAVFQTDVLGSLNGFVPFPGSSWSRYFKVLQLLGARYFVADLANAPESVVHGYPLATIPRRRNEAPGLWRIYELPRPNIGDYSPTEVLTAATAVEIAAMMRDEKFDFTRQVILSASLDQLLAPAKDMKLSLIRDGLHVSGTSPSTSLVVLPQQFSHCLRAGDSRVRIVRADLMMTGILFSGAIDTDILFDYGIFTPECRRADLADVKRLQMKIDRRMPHLTDRR